MDVFSGIDLLSNSKLDQTSMHPPPLHISLVHNSNTTDTAYNAPRPPQQYQPTIVSRTSSVCSMSVRDIGGDADSVDELIDMTHTNTNNKPVPINTGGFMNHNIPSIIADKISSSDDDCSIMSESDASSSRSKASRSRSHDRTQMGSGRGRANSNDSGGYNKPTREDETKKKQLIYRLDRMEQKGAHLPRRYTMNDPLENIEAEYERLKQNRDIDVSVRFQRRMLVACVTGLEFMNTKFDPFDVKLNGWSDSINENLDDYDDVFEELFLKYRGKAKMAPEINLMMMVGGSGLMFHLTNSMFRSSNMPDLGDVMKRNPDLMRQFTKATLDTMNNNPNDSQGSHRPPPPPPRTGGGGIMGAIGSMFGLGGGGGGDIRIKPHHPPAPPQNFMRGPKNVDEILRELQSDVFESKSDVAVKSDNVRSNDRDRLIIPPTTTTFSLSPVHSMDIGSIDDLVKETIKAPASNAKNATKTKTKATGGKRAAAGTRTASNKKAIDI